MEIPGLKLGLILTIAILLPGFCFSQNCSTNISCGLAKEICSEETDTIDCSCPDHDTNTTLWFEVEFDSEDQNVSVSANGTENHTIKLYGPLQTKYNCETLGDPIDSIIDSAALNYTVTTSSEGIYLLSVQQKACAKNYRSYTISPGSNFYCPEQLDTVICENCIGSFAPIPGEKYLVTAWTKEDNPAVTKTSYTYPEIYIDIPSTGDTLGPFQPTGKIIDGWQRIESEFTVPAGATDIEIRFSSTSGDVYFDDVRVLPFDGSMKTFVYDPVNMRLVAELDERHYATYYEYNEEGQLVRIKKETERGIMTIQETRNNSSK